MNLSASSWCHVCVFSSLSFCFAFLCQHLSGCVTIKIWHQIPFCGHTPHFLKHLLSLQLLLTCAMLPTQPAVPLFHSFRPQNHNSSLCFEMLFRRCVNAACLLRSLRVSLTLLTCCKSYNYVVFLFLSGCLVLVFFYRPKHITGIEMHPPSLLFLLLLVPLFVLLLYFPLCLKKDHT